MAYQKILTIQDISCVGQCSMTVALPILSACGHEVCILPSKLLSTHTGGFGKPAVLDLAGVMAEAADHWQRAGIRFDAVYIGYLGSMEAIAHAQTILDTLLVPGGRIIADPAMADHGKLYSGFDAGYAKAMQALCEKADVMLPNITEAAMMTGLPYRDTPDERYIQTLLESLEGRNVILTGVGYAPEETGAAIRHNGKISTYLHRRFPKNYHGTGDIFAACFTGAWLRGFTLEDAAGLAADVTCKCIEDTQAAVDGWYGVRFETALPYLIRRLEAEN